MFRFGSGPHGGSLRNPQLEFLGSCQESPNRSHEESFTQKTRHSLYYISNSYFSTNLFGFPFFSLFLWLKKPRDHSLDTSAPPVPFCAGSAACLDAADGALLPGAPNGDGIPTLIYIHWVMGTYDIN